MVLYSPRYALVWRAALARTSIAFMSLAVSKRVRFTCAQPCRPRGRQALWRKRARYTDSKVSPASRLASSAGTDARLAPSARWSISAAETISAGRPDSTLIAVSVGGLDQTASSWSRLRDHRARRRLSAACDCVDLVPAASVCPGPVVCITGAIQDVRSEDVSQRRGESLHEAGQRPQREHCCREECG